MAYLGNPAADGERAGRLEVAARARVRTSKVKITKIEHQRNGMSAEPFYVVLFRYLVPGEESPRNMIATVFRTAGHVAVFDRDGINRGAIAFGGTDGDRNSWRGDTFEADLRAAIFLSDGNRAWS